MTSRWDLANRQQVVWARVRAENQHLDGDTAKALEKLAAAVDKAAVTWEEIRLTDPKDRAELEARRKAGDDLAAARLAFKEAKLAAGISLGVKTGGVTVTDGGGS